MSLTLHWWYLPILLALIPVVYARFRTSGGMWDFEVDAMFITAACWLCSLGILIGHWLAVHMK